MLKVIYSSVGRMTKTRELLLFRNTSALGEHKGMQEWACLAIDSQLKQFSLQSSLFLHV